MGFYRHFDISREMCALSPIHSPFAVPYAVLADKSRIQSIESSRAFPAPYTTLRPSRPFQVILVTAEALRFVERRRGRRSATAPPPNPAPPYAVLADVRPSASALSVRRVPDAAARTDGRRCLCSWTSRRRAPPRRSPAYSPSSPAARGSVAPWPSFVDRSRRYAWRYELLLGEVSRPPLRHPNFAPPTQYSPTYDPRRLLYRSGQLVLWCRDALSGVLLVLRAPAGARPTALLRPRCVSASKQHVWLPPRAFLPSFRERRASRFPSTHSCGPLRSILQRETLGVHSFRAGGAAGGRRRRRTCCGLCLWPSRRRRPRLDCRWSSWRWPGHLRWPRAVPTETRGRIKAVMSLCCGSISSSFRAPAGVRPTVLRASTAPGKPHPRRAASGRTRRPPAAPAARRLQELIRRRKRRTSHPLLRLTRRSRRRRAENLLPNP